MSIRIKTISFKTVDYNFRFEWLLYSIFFIELFTFASVLVARYSQIKQELKDRQALRESKQRTKSEIRETVQEEISGQDSQ